MLQEFINKIIADGKHYPSGRLGSIVRLLQYTPKEKIDNIPKDEAILSATDQAIEACNHYMTYQNNTVKTRAKKLKQNLIILKNPENYFKKLVTKGSAQFHLVNIPLQKILFTDNSTISISDSSKNQTIETYKKVTKVMQKALPFLSLPIVTERLTADDRQYLHGRITRRLNEIPAMEQLLSIRLKMNRFEQEGFDQLNKTVTQAVVIWRGIYLDMIKQQQPYLELSKSRVLTNHEDLSNRNFGYVAKRIKKAIKSLKKALQNCKLSKKEYDTLTDTLDSTISSPVEDLKPQSFQSGVPITLLFDPKEAFKKSVKTFFEEWVEKHPIKQLREKAEDEALKDYIQQCKKNLYTQFSITEESDTEIMKFKIHYVNTELNQLELEIKPSSGWDIETSARLSMQARKISM